MLNPTCILLCNLAGGLLVSAKPKINPLQEPRGMAFAIGTMRMGGSRYCRARKARLISVDFAMMSIIHKPQA
jgi:hypothetical protein